MGRPDGPFGREERGLGQEGAGCHHWSLSTGLEGNTVALAQATLNPGAQGAIQSLMFQHHILVWAVRLSRALELVPICFLLFFDRKLLESQPPAPPPPSTPSLFSTMDRASTEQLPAHHRPS